MTRNLFRPSALNKLSSPDRFDEALRVPAAKQWSLLAGVLLLSAATAIWGWFGSVTTTTAGRAVLVRAGGVLSVNASAAGQVVAFAVKPGDTIRANQAIARVSNPNLAVQVRLAEEALEEARREAERSARLRSDTAALRTVAMDRERGNLEREIAGLQEQGRFASEVVTQQEQLFAEGLSTRHPLVDAQHKAAALQNEIARRRARIDQLQAERFVTEGDPQDADAAARARVAELERRLAALRAEFRDSTTVVSTYGGEVLEVKTYLGAQVVAGSPLVAIQPRERRIEALAYVPSAQAKMVRPGMEAQLSPSTVRREEHGFLRATVLEVSSYPLTPLALTRRFENESLTATLTGAGPVTEVRLALFAEAAEVSGYGWSTPRGPGVALSSGTLCEVLIVTRRQRPVSLILPLWRERLGLS